MVNLNDAILSAFSGLENCRIAGLTPAFAMTTITSVQKVLDRSDAR
jgi:hypothetical protein